MRVRSVFYAPAIVLALALLIVVAGVGAIVALVYHGRRSGFSYFAGGTTTTIKYEGDIASNGVPIL
jgi:hypothetical protein